MEWETFWNSLLDSKKLSQKVEEMNQADEALGNETKIEEICHQIYDDYIVWRENLESVKREFLKIIDSLQGVHLQCSRIKGLKSLLEKVITKRYENLRNKNSDYAHISGENYKQIITDLIGMRLILNYRGKWTEIHEELIGAFPLKERDTYEGHGLLPHPLDRKPIQVEIPKAYYAEGDDIQEYINRGLNVNRHKKGYRSIHYTVSFSGVYIEVQVRTIYDEAWSDCDHNYVYKQDENKSHTALARISEILCKLTNLSNDMGESMREIFEAQSVIEISGNKWETSSEILDKFDKSLARIEDACNDLKIFRNRLQAKEA